MTLSLLIFFFFRFCQYLREIGLEKEVETRNQIFLEKLLPNTPQVSILSRKTKRKKEMNNKIVRFEHPGSGRFFFFFRLHKLVFNAQERKERIKEKNPKIWGLGEASLKKTNTFCTTNEEKQQFFVWPVFFPPFYVPITHILRRAEVTKIPSKRVQFTEKRIILITH